MIETLAALLIMAAPEPPQAPVIRTMPIPPPIIYRPAPPAPPPPPGRYGMPAKIRSGSISAYDYPPSALRAEEQGAVRVSYAVGIDGRVSNCVVVQSSGSLALDSETCKLITRRFRFIPATDAAGAKIVSTKTQRMKWMLPIDAIPIAVPANWFAKSDYRDAAAEIATATESVSYSLTVDSEGAPIDCSIELGSGSALLDQRTCTIVKRRARFQPVRDFEGLPATGVYEGTIDWRIAPEG